MHKPNKYCHYKPIKIGKRAWPDRRITKAPRWCSVDLRDGNQALISPLSVAEKLEFFAQLVKLGFKEIEVAFPSASQTDFDFVRQLIEKKLIPADVTIQVLVQAREDLIERTIKALQGAQKPIVHLYNSTSKDQREIVFRKTKSEIVTLAVQGIQWIKKYAAAYQVEFGYEYTPESFTGTELDFALEICNAVIAEVKPTPKNKLIINLPSTVELATPNIYADSIEWISNRLKDRKNIVLSVHTHNDRGCAVAAAELAMLAGAERVEGTLFGNGERTGNVDLITLALNLYTQGIDPRLDLSNIDETKKMVERMNKLPVSARHPYAGELVYTAFSGSHQDAINKGLKYQRESKSKLWRVPYLPIDPADVGRTYDNIIRLNSQSGKGGIAYILKEALGLNIPRPLQIEFAKVVQRQADYTGEEIAPGKLIELFKEKYFSAEPLRLLDLKVKPSTQGQIKAELQIKWDGKKYKLSGSGNGPLAACQNALAKIIKFEITNYSEDSLGQQASAQAEAYVEIALGRSKNYGVGIETDITMAAVKALFSALNAGLNK